MKEQDLLNALEELAGRLDIEVRHEAVEGEEGVVFGGLCRLQGRFLLILNPIASPKDRIALLARAVNQFDLGGVYLIPVLREFLENFP